MTLCTRVHSLIWILSALAACDFAAVGSGGVDACPLSAEHSTPNALQSVSPLSVAAARSLAEDLERDEDFRACGEVYLAAHEFFEPVEGDELLYNTGVCFGKAGLLDRAETAFEKMVLAYPRSRLRNGSAVLETLHLDRDETLPRGCHTVRPWKARVVRAPAPNTPKAGATSDL